MQSLFPTNSGSDGLAALLTVPAGKCNMVRITNSAKYTVTADKRRGNISLVKGADGLIHFRWANGSNGNIEDDRMIFPGDCEFKKVKTGREQDRVYMLKYMSGGQRLMYWMQNKSTEKDEELVKKINDLFNNPNAATTTASSGGATAGPGANAGISQDEWMQLLGMTGARPPSAPAAQAASSSATAPTSAPGFLDLSSILSSVNSNQPVATPATATSATGSTPANNTTDDSDNNNDSSNSGDTNNEEKKDGDTDGNNNMDNSE